MNKKIIGILICIIFIGTSFIPSISGNIKEVHINKTISSQNYVIIFRDDFNDNTKDYTKWSEIYSNGIWEEINGRTELQENENLPGYEGIISKEFRVSISTTQSAIFSCDMYSDIAHYENWQWVGVICFKITDGENFIYIGYNRNPDYLFYRDSIDDETMIIGYRDDGIWTNEITLFSNRYKVDMGGVASGIVNNEVFSSSDPKLRVILYMSAGGEYSNFWLRVGFDNVLVTGQPGNNPPNKPSRPSGPTSGYTGFSYTFSTSATDPDNDQIRYGWDWDGDNSVDEWSELNSSGLIDSRQHSWGVADTYKVRVISEDEHGANSGFSLSLTVTIENEPLVVDADGPYKGNIMEDIEFDCTVTGGIPPYEYLWDYGDGNTSTGDPHPTHNYGNAGNYTVTLTVTDSENDTASDTTWTYINAPPNTPIIDGPNSGKPGTLYTYTFTSTDPDGNDISEYIINWGDGLNETITGPFISGTPQTKNHTWDEEGTYTIEAKASDIYGAESDWAILEVSMPKSKAINLQLILNRFFQRFPMFEKILNQTI